MAVSLRAESELFELDLEELANLGVTSVSEKKERASEVSLQLYDDLTKPDDGIYRIRLDTFDAELAHRFSPVSDLEVVWGASQRMYADRSPTAFFIVETHAIRRFDPTAGFVQAELRTHDEKLRVTLGSTLERNACIGLEHQAELRAAFIPNENLTFYVALSRAVRTLARGSQDVRATPAGRLPPAASLPTELSVLGNGNQGSEDLRAHELGLRWRATDRLFVDLAGCYDIYDNIHTFEMGALLCTDGTPTWGQPKWWPVPREVTGCDRSWIPTTDEMPRARASS